MANEMQYEDDYDDTNFKDEDLKAKMFERKGLGLVDSDEETEKRKSPGKGVKILQANKQPAAPIEDDDYYDEEED
jgi:hypothetical protein